MKVAYFAVFVLAMASSENLVEFAARLGANKLVQLVTDAGLLSNLTTGGPLTMFAPTDAAFAKLPKAAFERLMMADQFPSDLLKYHMVSGNVYSRQLVVNDMTAPSLLVNNGTPVHIRFNTYKKGTLITVNGSPLITPNQNASNGVIHLIDRVLFPIPLKRIPEQLATKRGRFSTLQIAVEKASRVSALAGGPITLFAPTNAAFAKVPGAILQKLLANVVALTHVLDYHVVKGTIWSANFTNGEMIKTVLQGKSLIVNMGAGGAMINNAKVEEADIAVINGVLHVIDTVLLPPAFVMS